MPKERVLPLMLSIPKECRDRLREIAARKNLNNPDQVTLASTIAREIICKFLDETEAVKQEVACDDRNRIEAKWQRHPSMG